MTMGFEPGVRGELSSADVELKPHRRHIAVSGDAALADVRGALGEGSDEREHSRPDGAHASGLTRLEVEHVHVRMIRVSADERESSVPLTPRFDVR